MDEILNYKLESLTSAATAAVALSSGVLLFSTTGSDILTNIENLVGGNYNDNLKGNFKTNTLDGKAGNDTLTRDPEADVLIGDLGNDIFVINNMNNNVVIENINEGVDLERSGVTYILPANVENLTLTGTSATNGTG